MLQAAGRDHTEAMDDHQNSIEDGGNLPQIRVPRVHDGSAGSVAQSNVLLTGPSTSSPDEEFEIVRPDSRGVE